MNLTSARRLMRFVVTLLLMGAFTFAFAMLLASRQTRSLTGRYSAVRDGPGPWYNSIQAAINDAGNDPSNPDTIYVYSATYDENINLTTPVNIIGIHDNGDVRVRANTQGRALTISGPAINSSITISGLSFEDGDATSDNSIPELQGCGGAVLIANASPNFVGNNVRFSTASNSASLPGAGGGICLVNSNAILTSNLIDNNTAAFAGPGNGGGIYIKGGAPTLKFNSIVNNNASTASAAGNGGGVYLDATAAALIDNGISGNTAASDTTVGGNGDGGGIYVTNAPPGGPTLTLKGNLVGRNTASAGGQGRGGGIFLAQFTGTIESNVIIANTGSSVSVGQGGGTFLDGGSPTLAYNEIISNNATDGTGGGGGGLYLLGSPAQLIGNTIVDNYECGADTVRSGGMRIENSTNWTLISNVISRNRPPPFPPDQFAGTVNCSTRLSDANQSYEGYGISIANSSGTMLHTTIADHNGFYPGIPDHPNAVTITQAGMDVEGNSTVMLVNSIISSQQIGVRTRSANATVNLSHTLFFDNTGGNTDKSAGGTITSASEFPGNPQFVNNSSYPKPDYHITFNSAARDTGTATAASVDFDGEPRIFSNLPDLGADEFTQGFLLSKTPSSNPAIVGTPLTYVLSYKLKNDAPVANVMLTDSLPEGVTDVIVSGGGTVSGNTVTWSLGTLAPNASGSVTVQMTPTTPGITLLNTARIRGGDFTTEATASVAVRANDQDGLRLTKTPAANPAFVGVPLVYTLTYRLVGTAGVANVILTDTLPPGVTAVSASNGGVVSGSTVTWRLGTLAPGATGSVTVQMTMPGTPGATVLNSASISGDGFAAEASASVVLQLRQEAGSIAVYLPLITK